MTLPPTGIAAADELAAALRGRTAPANTPLLRDALIESLVRGEGRPHAVWHPLGCLYVELARDEHFSLRLHVWDRRTPPAADGALAIHAHDFDLASCVLGGALEQVLYRVVPGSPTHQRYAIDYQGEENVLRPTGTRCRAVVGAARKVTSGQCYRMPARRFHRAGPVEDAPAITFVVAALRSEGWAPLLGPLDGQEPLRTRRRPCARDEMVEVLDRLRLR